MKKWFVLPLLILIVAILVSACGTQTPSATSQAPAPTTSAYAATSTVPATTAKPTTPTTPQPITGGIMKFAMTRPPVSFGYPPKISGPDNHYARPFFERLIAQDNTGTYVPELALSWDVSADGKTLTFKLRQGVQFSDGTDFNADAVKWNFDGLIPPKSNVLPYVSSIDVVDPYTVRFNLPSFNNLIFYSLAVDMRLCMVSPTAVQKNGVDWATTHPVGTGPYILKSFEPNSSITYTKNPNYWNKGLPYLDGIVASAISDAMTQAVSLKSGDINFIWDAQPTTAAQLRDAGYNLQIAPGTLQSISMDTVSPDSIFADQRIREAVEYAIDKEAIVNGPGMGLYKAAYQVVPTTSSDYNTTLAPRKYDPVKAQQLLAAAGKPNGFEFTYFLNQAEWRDGYIMAQDYLAKVGIKMNISLIAPAVFETNMRQQGKIDKSGSTQSIFEMRANNLFMFDSYLRTTSPYYGYMVRPAGIDALINQAEAVQSEAAKTPIMQQICKLVYDNEPFVPMWIQPRIMVTDKLVQNPGFMINGDAMNGRLGYNSWLSK
jgi:peptide/nickel transport system substrate-binding protein